MSEKLKPCPFCEKEGYVYKTETAFGGGAYSYYPRCRTENCIGNNGWVSFETEEEAIKAWNRRPSQNETIQRGEEMTDAEKIKQATGLLHPFTTHESHGNKMQQVINDTFEMLEWGHLEAETEPETEGKK